MTPHAQAKQKRKLGALKARKRRNKRRVPPELGWSFTDADAGQPGAWRRLNQEQHV